MDAQRIRVFFSDPDATDSDSGDDPTSVACAATKSAAGKTEILILHGGSRTAGAMAKKNPAGAGCDRAQAAIGSPAPAASIGKRAFMSSAAPARRHSGVYERQPGRWAAEFRSHRRKVRHWVGTFATEAAAKAAYDAFEREFFLSSSPRCGRPPASDGNGGGVRIAPRPPPDDKQQIVLALTATAATTTRMMLPPADAMAASVTAAPCVSSSTSADAMAASCVSSSTSASSPALFDDARPHEPSIHSFWAEPADEDLVGLADLAHLPLLFSGDSMDFDPADLSLFDDGFL